MATHNPTADNTESVFRDGGTAEPLTDAELEAIRSTFEFYDSTGLIPRLMATIDRDRNG